MLVWPVTLLAMT